MKPTFSNDLIERLIKELAPRGYQSRDASEAKYPPRDLPTGSEVMRVPPSPTGMVHIGTIYAGLINERVAHQSNGVFILRIEDTDKKREVEGSLEMIVQAFKAFELAYDEGPEKEANYGPYLQSMREQIYLGYAVDLLQKGRAYPCFATSDELQAATIDQQVKKQRPGYYAEWALWRGKSEDDIVAALDADKPFVLRFRSEGDHNKRIHYTDIFKGKMEVPENDLDVPLIKSDESRLPTYHLAHIVDDSLMGTTKVFRSDEWLPSTALHIELCQALGLSPFTYGHFAPISIIDKNGGGKRKLSKRKDAEADVAYWLSAGYPVKAVKAYLLGLANSNFEDWYRSNPDKSIEDFPLSIEKLTASRAPLLDTVKLEDYCKEYIARLPQTEFEAALREWAKTYATYLLDAADADSTYASKVFSIERDDDNPRKDLAKWSDAPEQYGYFFDSLFDEHFVSRIDAELSGLTDVVVQKVCKVFLESYDPKDSQEEWLSKFRAGAESTEIPLRDYAKIIRVKLTGKNRTPDLYAIIHIMGEDRTRSRLS